MISDNKNIKIYVLCDPNTDEIRYIGQTKVSIKNRINRHYRESETGIKTKKCN